MDDHAKYDLIERYLSGELDKAKQTDFEKQLKSDVALRGEVALHRQVEETLKGEKVHQFRTTLKKVDKKWKTTEPQTQVPTKVFSLPIRKILVVAASFLALIIAYQVMAPKAAEAGKNLYADHFEPYKMILNQRSVNVDATNPNLLIDAITAYENKDFARATEAFSILQKERPELVAFRFYTAMSELSRQNTAAAIPLFQKILTEPQHLFMEQSQWYLALAYLQQEDQLAAKKQLELISPEAFKYEDAQDILKTLD